MEQLGYHWTDFDKIRYLCSVSEISREKLSFKFDKVTGTLHEDVFTSIVMSRLIILRMRTASDKSCREYQNTFYGQQLFYENSAVFLIMWNNMAQPEGPQKTIYYGA